MIVWEESNPMGVFSSLEYGLAATLALTAIGAVIWFVRLEGRVMTVESHQNRLYEWLERIDGKLDQLLGRSGS